MIFPTHVYRCPGQYIMTDGLSWSCKTANDIKEYDEAMQDGWCASIELAKDQAGDNGYIHRKVAAWRKKKKTKKKQSLPSIDSPPTRSELEQKATQLGIKFDGRTTDKRLGEKIGAAL